MADVINITFGESSVTTSFDNGVTVPVTIGADAISIPITFAAVGEPRDVIDNLLSTRTDAALAANQGRELGDSDLTIRADYGDSTADFAAYFQSLLVA